MGEAKYLVETFKVEKVIFNCGEFNELEQELIKALNKKKKPYYTCIKELNIDNNKLYFLQTKLYNNENDNSNVIYTKINGYKFMFMGDAGIDKEKDILDKWRYYKNELNREFSKNEFNRLVYLHPNLMQQINDLAREFYYNYHYEPADLIKIFNLAIHAQLHRSDCEQYIKSAYISICSTFLEIKPQIDDLYNDYNNIIEEDRVKTR